MGWTQESRAESINRALWSALGNKQCLSICSKAGWITPRTSWEMRDSLGPWEMRTGKPWAEEESNLQLGQAQGLRRKHKMPSVMRQPHCWVQGVSEKDRFLWGVQGS